MMKKMFVMLVALIAVMLLCCSGAGAENGYIYELYQEHPIAAPEYVIIKGYEGDATQLAIPAQIEGLPVRSIGYDAFKGMTSLTSVVIPDSVEGIGANAFEGCTNLVNVTLPHVEGLSLYEGAFKDCSALTSITLPADMTYVPRSLFEGCASLKEVVLPYGIKSISDYAFMDCSSLTEISLPETVTYLGSAALAGTGLTSYVVPAGI